MHVVKEQQQRLFFDGTPGRQYASLRLPPTDQEIKVMLANSALKNIVVSEKNRGSMRILNRFAFCAYTDPTRSCRGMNWAIYSSPGQGKTFVVTQWANAIGIPFLFVQSDSLETTWMLFERMRNMFEEWGTPLVPQSNERHYTLPPCIVFFDEAHALSKELRTGGLLNAMEYNDGWLRTVPPGRNQLQYVIDCSQVCWIAASTDPGILLKQSGAFYDRLRNHLQWAAAGKKEIAEIVRLDSAKKTAKQPRRYQELPLKICQLVAHYEQVPRKALAFADNMQLERRSSGADWEKAAAIVAEDNRLDTYGMPYIVIDILRTLARRPVSDKNMPTIARCRKEQFDVQYAPFLLDDNGQGPLALPTSKGWAITKTGIAELDRRHILHRGDLHVADRYL